MNTFTKIKACFFRMFGEGRPVVLTQAPGRVNLIGEHTDYNDGFVLPMAIAYHIVMAGRRRNDSLVQVYSVDFDEWVTFSVEGPMERDQQAPWSDYIRGVLWAFRETGVALKGMDLAFGGDLPLGAGLSSSAALEVATALMVQQLNRISMSLPETALLCQKAENEFVGMKCGIMDQFASLLSRENHALFLDCRSLAFELIPMALGDYRIVICHSGVKHELVASHYNQRRQSCMDGVRILQQRFPEVMALRDVTPMMLETARAAMDETVYRRCRHVISENGRVSESIRALRQGDLQTFGRLMNASHDSLRDDYEVSCPEVDLLVDLARNSSGVLGARITGGGFGGCTVNLVSTNALSQFEKKVLTQYCEKTGLEARVYVCAPANGAMVCKW